MSENEGPVPVTSAWLNAAYIPPDDVTTGPIPTITDDMTADDVARLSQVQALMSSSAPSATDPTVAEDPGAGQASALEKQAVPDDGTAETVSAAPVEVAASREPAEEETVTGGGADVGSGESVDDSEAVTTMFAVVTEEVAEDAETTSFAAVDPWMEPSIAQNRVVLSSEEDTGAGAPPLRRQRSRAVLIAMAGALVVVILGVMAAVAFGGQRDQDPNPAPVPSVPASAPPTLSSTAGPDKAFPH
ncbi:MAG: hypothetical protein JWN52_3320 [Actinomycetia bacterium]|nr:hypothetical protein [Actinomycetes bacterium]